MSWTTIKATTKPILLLYSSSLRTFQKLYPKSVMRPVLFSRKPFVHCVMSLVLLERPLTANVYMRTTCVCACVTSFSTLRSYPGLRFTTTTYHVCSSFSQTTILEAFGYSLHVLGLPCVSNNSIGVVYKVFLRDPVVSSSHYPRDTFHLKRTGRCRHEHFCVSLLSLDYKSMLSSPLLQTGFSSKTKTCDRYLDKIVRLANFKNIGASVHALLCIPEPKSCTQQFYVGLNA
jgi:hypothetical protein